MPQRFTRPSFALTTALAAALASAFVISATAQAAPVTAIEAAAEYVQLNTIVPWLYLTTRLVMDVALGKVAGR